MSAADDRYNKSPKGKSRYARYKRNAINRRGEQLAQNMHRFVYGRTN